MQELVRQQVSNFKKYLEKEQKNLTSAQSMPTIEELLEFTTTGIKKGTNKTSYSSKRGFMDTKVINAYSEI